MASDFGDESGEKLIDWLVRIGERSGERAMLEPADRLEGAFRRAREGMGGKGAPAKEWAKLDMKDFAELPQYESLKEIIGSELSARSVEHAFASEGGRELLVFRTKDVHEVDDVFHRLEQQVAAGRERAREAIAPSRDRSKEKAADRDSEPLERRAAEARRASRALQAEKGADREISLSQTRSK
ncbi:hypothetical protein [Slackia isoflavoniconvertens]|uniref:hypothetical protein n=1 Tax=Slackia isoflavoniconvertens TaxID=572010 RepID=UPI003F9DBC1E